MTDYGKEYNFKIQTLEKRKNAPDINYRKYNNFVKKYLIEYKQEKDNSLLDLATGKGSDIYKWINSDYSLIMGIDSSYENIFEKNGFLDRLNNIETSKEIIPIWGNCFKEIRSGKAGENTEERKKLKTFFKNHPRFKFDKITINFAIHYFMTTPKIWGGFYNNIKNLLKKNGLFIGTYLDGNKILNILDGKTEKKFFNKNKQLIYTIKYKNKNEISVKTETWEHFIDEPLILNKLPIINKHFELIEDSPFSNLDIKMGLSSDEKLLSEINRYFIYKRI